MVSTMVLRSNCVCFPRNSSTLQNKRCSHSRCVYQWVPAGPAQPGQQDADEADLSEGPRSALGAHGLCHNLCRRSRSLDKRGLFWDSLALPQLSRRVWIQIPIFCRATVTTQEVGSHFQALSHIQKQREELVCYSCGIWCCHLSQGTYTFARSTRAGC